APPRAPGLALEGRDARSRRPQLQGASAGSTHAANARGAARHGDSVAAEGRRRIARAAGARARLMPGSGAALRLGDPALELAAGRDARRGVAHRAVASDDDERGQQRHLVALRDAAVVERDLVGDAPAILGARGLTERVVDAHADELHV